jgi:hypothetical protein
VDFLSHLTKILKKIFSFGEKEKKILRIFLRIIENKKRKNAKKRGIKKKQPKDNQRL